MNHIYTTRAIIIKSMPAGEANRSYFLLTRDLGFIRAMAQGVRLDKSKLKGHLQEFSLASVSIVKGRELWRITSAETMYQEDILHNHPKLSVIKNIFSLLLRLLHGEEKNEMLFGCIEMFYLYICAHDCTADDLKNLETITVLRILSQLGYFKKSFDFSAIADTTVLSSDMISAFGEKRKQAVFEINEALAQTNL